MKNSLLMLSTLTAINGLSIISCQTTEHKGINVGVVVDGNGNLLNADTTDYKNDIRIFRQNMDKRIESNHQNLSEIRTKITKENKEANSDFSTTIFELEMANGYMKIKLEDYKPRKTDKWKIFKKEFSKVMDEWNIEFADFAATL